MDVVLGSPWAVDSSGFNHMPLECGVRKIQLKEEVGKTVWKALDCPGFPNTQQRRQRAGERLCAPRHKNGIPKGLVPLALGEPSGALFLPGFLFGQPRSRFSSSSLG